MFAIGQHCCPNLVAIAPTTGTHREDAQGQPPRARARRTAAEQAAKAAWRHEGCLLEDWLAPAPPEGLPKAGSAEVRRKADVPEPRCEPGGGTRTGGARRMTMGAQSFRPVRPGAGKGFLRCRLHCRHQGPQVAQDRRGRPDHPRQSRASWRSRRRSARRRRRRHPGSDAAQIFRQEGGRTWLHAAEAGPLCRRHAVPAARRRLARRRSWTPTPR